MRRPGCRALIFAALLGAAPAARAAVELLALPAPSLDIVEPEVREQLETRRARILEALEVAD
ncbi:MAG TPA: hypothetical protein VK831_03285, partial [Candidatus Deferrimicrobiaceae bacterium]|nr:hypothetical protein [Candidatus Deferrimicrobiaceae bacterium]